MFHTGQAKVLMTQGWSLNSCIIRIKTILDEGQPENNVDSEPGDADARIEEHLFTTNLVLQKTVSLDVPVRILSLDLSKTFDKVKREKFGKLVNPVRTWSVGSHVLGLAMFLVWPDRAD